MGVLTPRLAWSGASRQAVLTRLGSPLVYLAVLGGIQVSLLWLLRGAFGTLPAALGTALLGLLLVLLLIARGVRWQWLLLLALVAVTTIGPALHAMAQRPMGGFNVGEHDGMVQIESAVDRLLAGQQIYGTDWSTTLIGRMPWDLTAGPNPALHHFAYLPLTVLVGVPYRLVTGALGLPFDYRVVLISFALVGLVAVVWLKLPPPVRLMVTVAVFLNPLIAIYFWTGRNDICYLAMLLVGLACLNRGRPVWACAAIGTAIAFKPFAVFAVPFLALVLWRRWRDRPDRLRRELWLGAGALGLVPLLTITPFLVADAGALYRDTVLYTNGGVPDAYPIAGDGFGSLLLGLHLVGDRRQAFPFAIFQFAAMIPALWFGGRALWRRPTLGRWLAAYAALFLAFGFFARFFNDNYVGVILALFMAAMPAWDIPLTAPAGRSPSTGPWR